MSQTQPSDSREAYTCNPHSRTVWWFIRYERRISDIHPYFTPLRRGNWAHFHALHCSY